MKNKTAANIHSSEGFKNKNGFGAKKATNEQAISHRTISRLKMKCNVFKLNSPS